MGISCFLYSVAGSPWTEWAFWVAVVKNPTAKAGDAGDEAQPLGQEDPLEEEMVTHFSILSWEIPRAEAPGGLQSIGLQRMGPD